MGIRKKEPWGRQAQTWPSTGNSGRAAPAGGAPVWLNLHFH